MSERREAPDLATRARWQRWEMDNLGPRPPKPAPAKPATDVQLQAQREQVLAQARAEGQKKGYQDGLSKGHTKGHAQGLELGHSEGHAIGLAEGHKQGLAEGHAEGLAQGLAEGGAIISAKAQALDQITAACAQSIHQLEDDLGAAIVQLAIKIAQQVLVSELHEHPDQIMNLVHDLLAARPTPTTTISLHLHPADLELVRQSLQENPDLSHYRLIADNELKRGGCIAKTVEGSIDATLDTRWQRVLAALGHTDTLKP